MADTHETIADLVAEMRHNATARRRFTLTDAFGGYETITIDRANTMLSLADRLEAAYKRDKAAIEADALAVGGMVEAARKRGCDDCAKLRDALQKAAESAAEIMERVRYKDGLAFSTANYIAGVAKDALAAEKDGGAA